MKRAIAVVAFVLALSACVPAHNLGPGMATRESWQAAPGAGVVARTPGALPVHERLEPDRPLALSLGGAGPTLEEDNLPLHAVLLALAPLREAHQVDIAFRHDVVARIRLLADDYSLVREFPRDRFVARSGYRLSEQATLFLNTPDRQVRYLLITAVRPLSTSSGPMTGPVPETETTRPANGTIELKRYLPETAASR